MNRRRWALVAMLVGGLALAGATVAPGAPQAVSVTVIGTLKLARFNPSSTCKFSPFILQKRAGPLPAGTKTLVAQCLVSGKFSGSPKAGAGRYGWNWYLQVGTDGKTTGLAAEYGAVTIPTSVGAVQLLTTGVQRPIGPQTSTHAKGLSKGTWKATNGVKGSGKYTFTTERKGSTFTTAVLKLTGAVSGKPKPPAASSKYSFSGLMLAWDQGGAHQSITVSGTGCGADPITATWSVTVVTGGGATLTVNPPPNFSVANPAPLGATVSTSGGVEVARMSYKLLLTPGTPPTMTLQGVGTGQVANVVAPPAQALTVTPVASCS